MPKIPFRNNVVQMNKGTTSSEKKEIMSSEKQTDNVVGKTNHVKIEHYQHFLIFSTLNIYCLFLLSITLNPSLNLLTLPNLTKPNLI